MVAATYFNVRLRNMLSEHSPFLNIPVALDSKQALFLDGLRHAIQISDLAYKRLCIALKDQADAQSKDRAYDSFVPIFLDAWAFIDAVDRFRSLWEAQPNAKSINGEFSAAAVRLKLQGIRDLRNISDHIAQKIDQIVSMNSSVLGSIRWLSLTSESPLRIRTCFIRPGIVRSKVNGQLAIPTKRINFVNSSACITVAAGRHEFLLDDAYELLRGIVSFAETSLALSFQQPSLTKRNPSDLIGVAELDVSGMERTT